MKNSNSVLYILSFAILFITLIGCSGDDTQQNGGFPPQPTEPISGSIHKSAVYEVTFDMQWTAENFPTDYPNNDHFSPLIGFSHIPDLDTFRIGQLASPGIKDMAELGATTKLSREIDTLIERKIALNKKIGSGVSNGGGKITIEIEVDSSFSAVSFMSMLAPSPDWYVAVLDEDLYLERTFVFERTVDALMYDAGTDAGVSYSSADTTLANPDTISLITSAPLGNGTSVSPAVAKVTFKRISVVTN